MNFSNPYGRRQESAITAAPRTSAISCGDPDASFNFNFDSYFQEKETRSSNRNIDSQQDPESLPVAINVVAIPESTHSNSNSNSIGSNNSSNSSNNNCNVLCGLFSHKQLCIAGLVLFVLVAAISVGLSASSKPKLGSTNESVSSSGIEESTIHRTRTGSFNLLEKVEHDSRAFTQGLEVLSATKLELMRRQWEQRAGQQASATTKPLVSPSSPVVSSATPVSKFILESTGQYGDSTIRVVDLASGNPVQTLDLDRNYFGEGCTYYYVPSSAGGGVVRVVQITWKSGEGLVYEQSVAANNDTDWNFDYDFDFNFERVGQFRFLNNATTTDNEGWGIIYHPLRNQFIVSDGSEYLLFWKLTESLVVSEEDELQSAKRTFRFDLVDKVEVQERRVVVVDAATVDANDTSSLSWDGNGKVVDDDADVDGVGWTKVDKLNELEWDPYSYGGNTILANVWTTNEIVRIWVGSEDDKNNNSINSINSDMGKISYVYDLSKLKKLAQAQSTGAVLNGIAFVYDSSTKDSNVGRTNRVGTDSNGNGNGDVENDNGDGDGDEEFALTMAPDQFWVTGKYWPKMYRIRLVDDVISI